MELRAPMRKLAKWAFVTENGKKCWLIMQQVELIAEGNGQKKTKVSAAERINGLRLPEG